MTRKIVPNTTFLTRFVLNVDGHNKRVIAQQEEKSKLKIQGIKLTTKSYRDKRKEAFETITKLAKEWDIDLTVQNEDEILHPFVHDEEDEGNNDGRTQPKEKPGIFNLLQVKSGESSPNLKKKTERRRRKSNIMNLLEVKDGEKEIVVNNNKDSSDRNSKIMSLLGSKKGDVEIETRKKRDVLIKPIAKKLKNIMKKKEVKKNVKIVATLSSETKNKNKNNKTIQPSAANLEKTLGKRGRIKISNDAEVDTSNDGPKNKKRKTKNNDRKAGGGVFFAALRGIMK